MLIPEFLAYKADKLPTDLQRQKISQRSSDNYHFYIREKLLYVDCMGGFSEWSHFRVKSRAFCTVSIKTYYPN